MNNKRKFIINITNNINNNNLNNILINDDVVNNLNIKTLYDLEKFINVFIQNDATFDLQLLKDIEVIKNFFSKFNVTLNLIFDKELEDSIVKSEIYNYCDIENLNIFTIKEHPIHKGYHACNNGNVYSSKGRFKSNFEYDGKQYRKLKPHKGGTNSYLSFTPFNKDINTKSKMVHKFIYECFNQVTVDNFRRVVSHKDGNTFNNKPNNLICETQQVNLKRRGEHGTKDNLYNNSRSILSKRDYEIADNLLKLGYVKHKDIGFVLGVSRVYISKLKSKLLK